MTLRVDQWLTERAPASDLASTLVCAWQGDHGEMLTPLPDECLDLFWVDDGSLWVSGPETRSWRPELAPVGNAVGIRFRAGVGPAMLGIPADEVRDTRIALRDLWPDRDARALTERLASLPDEHARMRALEDLVRRLAVDAPPTDAVAFAILEGLDRRRPASVRDLARDIRFSERQIHRRCTAAFGYGPATLSRIMRSRRLLRLARSTEREHGLASLAASAGYFDQQHLAHDVRELFATTPTELLQLPGVRSVQDISPASKEAGVRSSG